MITRQKLRSISAVCLFLAVAVTLAACVLMIVNAFEFMRIIVQCCISVMVLTLLALAAVLYERRTSGEIIEKAVEYSPVATMMANREGKILMANKAAESLFGYSREELLSMTVESLVPGPFRGNHAAHREDFHHHAKPRPMGAGRELYALRKDGWQVAVEIGLNPVETDRGRCVLASIVDITERKKAEDVLKRDKETLERLVDERSKALIKAEKDLKQFSRLADIGTLSATVAHELRNPLGVIHLAAYNLKREKAELGENKHLANIEKKVWEGNQIIDNLLSYSRIKIPNYESVHILNLFDECVNATQERFADKGIIVERKYGEGIDLAEVDPNQIREVLLNLLNNACQSCVGTSCKVELSAALEGAMLRFNVEDTGGGISQEDLQKVFEPFFTRKAKGTGLGLAICNELVSLHHGKIDIRSQQGQGTTVSVLLPLTRN